MLYSTRTNKEVTASEAIVKGLSEDGGLYIFKDFGGFKFDKSLVDLDYSTLAKIVLKHFFDELGENVIDDIIDKAYSKDNFSTPVDMRFFKKDGYLELFHGPTCAFKDMALTVLSGLLQAAKKKLGDDSRTLILTATSGDTGSATLSGFSGGDINAIVLYPNGGVSPVQEAQMQHFAVSGSRAIAVEGNFDDCQTLVKKVFSDKEFSHSVELSSANSINIGRLVPQVVYYVYSYLQLCKNKTINFGESVVFSVPTGNFGDILAGYIAKKMGVPIEKLICASNSNDVLTDFFRTGVYDRKRPFRKTISPSMDILVSSNLERLIYLESGCDGAYVRSLYNDLNEKGVFKVNEKIGESFKAFYPFSLDDEGTKAEIKRVFEEYGYLIDPHTAVASAALKSYRKESGYSGAGVVVSTASPYKFPIPVSDALSINSGEDVFDTIGRLQKYSLNPAPKAITSLCGEKFDATVWKKDEAEEELKKLILKY